MMTAVQQAQNQGAVFNPAVVVAQAALESGWGNSGLTIKANNLFGIKASKSWTGPTLDLPTKEWSKTKGWYKTVARWCVFESWADCVMYYYEMLKRLPWFQDALPYANDSDLFLKALLPEPGQPGWATDPNYKQKVYKTAMDVAALGGPKWV